MGNGLNDPLSYHQAIFNQFSRVMLREMVLVKIFSRLPVYKV